MTSLTYKELRLKLKTEQKALVAEHTKNKREGLSTWKSYQAVRINHIAYSLFRGKSFEAIESKWKHPENPNNEYIKNKALALVATYRAMVPPRIDIVAQDAVEVD